MYPVLILVLLITVGYYLAERQLPRYLARRLPRADKVLVKKTERRLYLLREGQVIEDYRIALGGNPTGHKRQEGDCRTPEGHYRLDWRNPRSRYYLSIHISYPDQDDRRWAQVRGVAPGGNIMIHGLPNWRGWWYTLLVNRDWTLGCIAVSNPAMVEIWWAVPDGTPIEILA